VIDLTGQRFGRLVVSGQDGKTRSGGYAWACVCDCGNRKTVSSSNLRRSLIKSCGCLQAANRLFHGHSTRTHRTRAYTCWSHMKSRCSNEKHPQYEDYGARGISVCERWMDFPNFLADMGEPQPGLSIDRINNDGNYEPGNCRWATQSEQNANRRPYKHAA
jgi:hypothetical protein